MDFESFYAAEYKTIFRATLAFSGDREAALDATQEAFSRAYARWRRLHSKEWAGGWTMTTALNLCRGKRSPKLTATSDTHQAQEVLDVDAGIDVSAALRKLPSRQREAILLYYLADLSVASVARLMSLSEGTVKTHLSRGREALAPLLLASIEEDG